METVWGKHLPVPHNGKPDRVVCGGDLVVEDIGNGHQRMHCKKCGIGITGQFWFVPAVAGPIATTKP